ncbi:MAG: hypothetical protein KKE23_04045 [Nanoarchaeota archaeon]|nr:hypothetical protein [Nanoarchaeota archaeon]
MVAVEEILIELGLSDKEVKVYLALLRLGQSSVTVVSEKANLNRVTTYDILKSLIEQGYVSYAIKEGIKYFEAVDPRRFLDELKERQEKVSSVMKELEGMKSSLKEKPKIEMYEEISGIKSIFQDILNENKEAWFIGAPKMLDRMEFYFPHFIKQKRKQKIFSRVITSDCKEMREYRKTAPKTAMDMRFVDEEIEITKIIYGDKVAFLTFREHDSIGIMIGSKDVSDFERTMFEILWKRAF